MLFFSFGVKAQQKHTISGFVVQDVATGEQLLGVNVIWKEKMRKEPQPIHTALQRHFPEGEVEIVYSYIGFEKVIKKIDLQNDVQMDIELSISSAELSEVTIVGEETVVDPLNTNFCSRSSCSAN